MRPTEDALRERYQAMETRDLVQLSRQGSLTEAAAGVLAKVLAARGVSADSHAPNGVTLERQPQPPAPANARPASQDGRAAQEWLTTFFEDAADIEWFVTGVKELHVATPSRSCIGALVKERPDRWLFQLGLSDGPSINEYVSPFPATDANVATFNRGVAELAELLKIYVRTGDIDRLPQQPSPFAELIHPDGLSPDWVQVHSFGESRTYVDRASIINRESGVLAWVRYELHPPGHDKINDKPVAEMWNCEEYDLGAQCFRLHRIVFKYVDGTTGETVRPIPDWKPATHGNRVTLEFLRSIVSKGPHIPPATESPPIDEAPEPIESVETTDAGLECLKRMHSRPMIDEPWTTRRERGFSWIGHRLAQHIDATPLYTSHDVQVSRVSFTSPVVRDVSAKTPEVHAILARVNRHAIASAYVYDEDEKTIRAIGLQYIHDGTVSWRADQLSGMACIQLCIAESEADYLAAVTGGAVAVDRHPESGLRENPDEIIGVLDTLFAPHGRLPSKFANEREFEALTETARHENAATFGATADGICFEFPFGDYTSLLRISTDNWHRRAGSGLYSRLYLPTEMAFQEAADVAAMLNRREAAGESVAGFCGAWGVGKSPTGRDEVVTYTEFMPNLMYLAGLTQEAMYTSMHRAGWVNQLLNHGARETDVREMLLRRYASELVEAVEEDASFAAEAGPTVN